VLGKGILPSSKQATEAIDLNRYLERWKALQGKSKGQDGKAYKRGGGGGGAKGRADGVAGRQRGPWHLHCTPKKTASWH
jgi:hypothetical protein